MKFTNESLKKKKKKTQFETLGIKRARYTISIASKGLKKLLARGSYTGDQKIFPPFFWILFP